MRAAKCGLKRGISLADARACFPNLAVAEVNPPADAALLDQLAALCDRFSPMVSRDRADGLILDITGCAHLFHGEAKLQALLIARLERAGLHVRCSIAGTPDAARALARFSQVSIVQAGEDEAVVQRLPIAAISDLSSDAHLALSRAGLKTIKAVAERPMAALAARFGEDFVTKLVRTLGRENVRITPLRALPPVIAERQFAEPMTQTDAIEDILRDLLEITAQMMEERGEGGRSIEARFFRSDGAIRVLKIETGRPTRNTKDVLRLFQERLQSLTDPIDPGFGFDAIRLCVLVTEPLSLLQPGFHGDTQSHEEIAQLIDCLTTRFGKERVLRFLPRETYSPERAAQLVPASNLKTGVSDCLKQKRDEPPLRPLHLFDPPQPIEAVAEVPDGPPRRFRWRRVLHDVAAAEGPERISPEWWRAPSNDVARDYYRVEDRHGGRFWIFRKGLYDDAKKSPRWFIHGLFA